MLKQFPILLISLIFLSCNSNVEGIWQSEKGDRSKFIAIKSEKGINIRDNIRKNRWDHYSKIAKNKYVNDNKIMIEILSNNRLVKSSLAKNNNYKFYYSKIPSNIPIELWAVSTGMKREMVSELFEKPKAIETDDEIEKWIYPDDSAIIFDKNGVIRTHKKYLIDKDYSQVKVGMTKKQVIELLGNPDRKTKTDRIKKENRFFYGKDATVIFYKDTVIQIANEHLPEMPILNIEDF